MMTRRPCLFILFLAPLLFSFLSAAPNPPAQAARKETRRLKKARWSFETSTFQSRMVYLDAQARQSQVRDKALQRAIVQTQARIEQASALLRSKTNFQAEPASSERTSTEPRTPEQAVEGNTDISAPAQPAPRREGQPSGGDPAAGLPSGGASAAGQSSGGTASPAPRASGQTAGFDADLRRAEEQLKLATAKLAEEKAALKEEASLANQYRSARQQLQDAAQGSEARYQALAKGDVKAAGGFYAQRVELDAQTKTEVIPAGACGDYPKDWCAAAPDSRIKFGGHWFLNRECVAYAAWKRWSKGMPFDTIDAGDWQGRSQDPTVGSVAIWNRGTVGRYGHVAYVTAVSRDSITVSEFNWRPWAHSLRTIPRASGGWPSRFRN